MGKLSSCRKILEKTQYSGCFLTGQRVFVEQRGLCFLLAKEMMTTDIESMSCARCTEGDTSSV